MIRLAEPGNPSRITAIDAEGWLPTKRTNSSADTSCTEHRTRASTLAERGRPSIADISPSSSPTPRRASTVRYPSVCDEVSFADLAQDPDPAGQLPLGQDRGAGRERASCPHPVELQRALRFNAGRNGAIPMSATGRVSHDRNGAAYVRRLRAGGRACR